MIMHYSVSISRTGERGEKEMYTINRTAMKFVRKRDTERKSLRP